MTGHRGQPKILAIPTASVGLNVILACSPESASKRDRSVQTNFDWPPIAGPFELDAVQVGVAGVRKPDWHLARNGCRNVQYFCR